MTGDKLLDAFHCYEIKSPWWSFRWLIHNSIPKRMMNWIVSNNIEFHSNDGNKSYLFLNDIQRKDFMERFDTTKYVYRFYVDYIDVDLKRNQFRTFAFLAHNQHLCTGLFGEENIHALLDITSETHPVKMKLLAIPSAITGNKHRALYDIHQFLSKLYTDLETVCGKNSFMIKTDRALSLQRAYDNDIVLLSNDAEISFKSDDDATMFLLKYGQYQKHLK